MRLVERHFLAEGEQGTLPENATLPGLDEVIAPGRIVSRKACRGRDNPVMGPN